MKWLDQLIAKTRRAGLLIDANILLLQVLGRFKPQLIGSSTRLEKYTRVDLDLVNRLVRRFDRLVTTPHILTEVSDLAPDEYWSAFVNDLMVFDETFVPARELVLGGDIQRLGLADAAIARCAQEGVLVLTDDLPLSQRLAKRRHHVLNLNHLRTYLLA
ncbi:MAG: hypothetical protein JOZ54_05555 [Acidobacteria bacterium]|nr:hypothetical protein [Acidobacteriota bacterium]